MQRSPMQPNSRSTSATLTHRGSERRMRTRMGCCVSIFRLVLATAMAWSGQLPVASRRTPGGLTRVLSAASWLARLRCVARPVPVRGLTQQRRDDEALAQGYLEVGLSAADPFTRPNRKGPSPMMLIDIDPHKSTHTATAIAPDANHEIASIRIDATLGEYRRLLTWARQWPQRRWAVEAAAISRLGCSPAAKTSSTCPRPRQRGCASFRVAAAARTTALTLPRGLRRRTPRRCPPVGG